MQLRKEKRNVDASSTTRHKKVSLVRRCGGNKAFARSEFFLTTNANKITACFAHNFHYD